MPWKISNNNIILGGADKIVGIDEFILTKAKYHRGRNLGKTQTWIFGIYDRTTKQKFMGIVPNQRSYTLARQIKQHLAPRSIIISDKLKL